MGTWTRGERGGDDTEYDAPPRNLLFPFGTGGDDDQLSEIELPPPGCIMDGIAVWDCREKRDSGAKHCFDYLL